MAAHAPLLHLHRLSGGDLFETSTPSRRSPEVGETISQRVVREVREETGITVVVTV